jgi:site-specific DNA-methyltransferase (adenine-specific)
LSSPQQQSAVYQGDALDIMSRKIKSASIDMVLTDLPYDSTNNRWDEQLPLGGLWGQWSRILKPNGIVALTAIQIFSSMAVMFKPYWFKHEWIWQKNHFTNQFRSHRAPMRAHEMVLIFANNGNDDYTFNGQKDLRYLRDANNKNKNAYFNRQNKLNHREKNKSPNYTISQSNELYSYVSSPMYANPTSIQKFDRDTDSVHPTQKPVSLFEYLIRTYTNKGDMVLDCCAGSGTAGVACMRSGRRFILIENDPQYIEVIKSRLKKEQERIVQRKNTNVDSVVASPQSGQ